jgi:pentatricopeptide repeat protein
MSQAERLFWRDMPARNLSYSVATTNSLMYMYAKLNRPDDALKVHCRPLPPRSVCGPH